MHLTATRRIIVAITGASGSIYGIRTLDALKSAPAVETHLVVSSGARTTMALETETALADVHELADVVHGERSLAASIASGSFETAGMIIAPCSIKTLSQVANCDAGNLIARAADVTLKERRRLVLMVRETPYHAGHLRLMTAVTDAGAVVYPPVPAFYGRPESIDEMVDHTIGRMLSLFGVRSDLYTPWNGPKKSRAAATDGSK